MSRSEDRRGFSDDTRLRLMEGDLDRIERVIREEFDELRSEMKLGDSASGKEIHAVQRVLIGVLISLTTATFMLAVNLLTK